MVHDPGSETTATDDDQNSQHNPYATRRDSRSWSHLPLEIPTRLLRRAAVAGHIRGFVQAPFSGAADIGGTVRRVAKYYRGWAATRHSIKIRRHFQGEGRGYSYQSRRSHARVGLGRNRLRRNATEHSILQTKHKTTMHCYRACVCSAGTAMRTIKQRSRQ